ncbi:FAD-binding protein [Phytohabitans sp. ZYX-F-186]|uniref:Electron transfer flavoprotein small subunit n=1 Tax=Phytohabitans maris TaxID=3071409 RepID=A0ABU0ZSU4_9ACTN|nr:FAD-binding protein [Phytohabitans sp. ZYX-F-186]MDQ7910106.1 FAD-binding protein [Phytohabitans sp. ZYX-F-186]
MRIAVLIKQVPLTDGLALGPDGRLRRDGVPSEINPHCRRAVAKGVELARESGGTCTVFTMGPPSAEAVLVESLAWGADDAVLITDPAFAGSDTLATARALVAALDRTGPYDLVLTGRNSVDADTGQVGPQVAELAGLPFLAAVRELRTDGSTVWTQCQLDEGSRESTVALPAVLACAERLCAPAKVPVVADPEAWRARVRRLGAADLGPGPWGAAGSPTWVGELADGALPRRAGVVVTGDLDAQVSRLLAVLDAPSVRPPAPAVPSPAAAPYGPRLVVVGQPERGRLTRELLGEAARLAGPYGGLVTAVLLAGDPAVERVGAWGADDAVLVDGAVTEAQAAHALAGWCATVVPRVLLAPGTSWGREVAARVAARLGAGLTGDAVALDLTEGAALRSWKPVANGAVRAAVWARTPTQLATVRPGVLPVPVPRPSAAVPVTRVAAPVDGRVGHGPLRRDVGVDRLAAARVVVGVGRGVAVTDYRLLHAFAAAVGGELAASRAVTDNGWLPHARQVGITGRSIAPDVYLALGLAGKSTHLNGVARAGRIVAVNTDPTAPIFGSVDLGIVADWRPVAEAVLAARESARPLLPSGWVAAVHAGAEAGDRGHD